MGYQALLFCPDEKTARTVTQVLSELDFVVVPCTEPFAAVKKLMGEHFDAVVVDCDNEQNATLLLKSARNAPNNQSALAVAVVEGQAGVAKAFRIGANLVLTKPINVDQAKGTLRVARGLLRKNESAKLGTASTPTTAKPATAAPAPGKPALVPSVVPTRPASAVSPLVVPSVPPRKPAPQPSFAASASSAEIESAEADDDVLTDVDSPKIVAATHESKPEIAVTTKTEALPSKAGLAVVASAGVATAAAPAREASASVAAQEKPSTVIAEAETAIEKDAADAVAASPAVEASALPAPTFTFGGAVEAGNKSASGGGSKKTLLAVAAVVVLAAAGYAAWTQFGHSSGTVTTPAPVAARPASAPAPVPQAAPSAAVSIPATVPPSAAPVLTVPAPTESAIPASTVSEQPSESAKASAPTTSAGKAHPGKANPAAKAAAEDVDENDAPGTKPIAQPLVIKKGSTRAGLGKSEPSGDAPAPSMTGIAASGNGGPLPNLMGNQSSAPAPVLQMMNISQGVSQGLVLKKTPPVYPANALRMRIEGTVELQATISKKGDISAVKILSGDANLARAAAEAVKQWKYKPYLLDGSPVEIQTQVTVNFKLPR
jgi:TonB family protein